MVDIKELLAIAQRATLLAGQAILEVYNSGDFSIEMKSDQSPLTRADKAAHSIIVSQLEETRLPILSEEGKNLNYKERKNWEYYWLVDPLDGTKEFIKRNGEFTVNIALMHSSIPVAGVIYAPCIDVLYFGAEKTGAFKIEKGGQTELPFISKKRTIEELLQKDQVTIVASRSHMSEETKTFINQFRNVNLSSMGSSLKLMLLAEGSADIYPRLAPTMEWDTAAGHAILRSLNMGVYQTNLQEELLYNKKELLNPSFIAF